jgi:hypothetical protein
MADIMAQLRALPGSERAIRGVGARAECYGRIEMDDFFAGVRRSGHCVILASPSHASAETDPQVLTAPYFTNDQRAVGPVAALDYYATVVPGVATPRRLAHDHVAFDHSSWRTNNFFFPDLS